MREQEELRDIKAMSMREKMQITDTNLSRLDAMAADVNERRAALLLEKLRAWTDTLPGEYPDEVILSLVRDEHFPATFRHMTERWFVPAGESFAPETLRHRFSLDNRLEQIQLCGALAHANDGMYRTGGRPDGYLRAKVIEDLVREGGTEDEMSELDIRPPLHTGERIAYMKNTYTDTAYEYFEAALPHAVPALQSDFQSVCEAVYYGRATACILPLENSTDGRLLRFYHLAYKYDLRIAMVTDVTAEETDVTTRYALLRRALSVPAGDEDPDSIYLECRVTPDEGYGLSDVLLAVDTFGLTPVRVDTTPSGDVLGETAFDLILRVGEGDLPAMLVFFYLMMPHYTILGIYTYI